MLRKNRIAVLSFFLIFVCFLIFFSALSLSHHSKRTVYAQAQPEFVATFHSMSIYWSPSGGSATNTCSVRYRVQGTSTWHQGYPLWYDSGEYRGSLVQLNPGTNYEVELSLESGTTVNSTFSTWSENFPVAQTIQVGNISGPLTISQSGSSSGYIVYENGTITGGQYNVQVNGSYIILRNLTLRDASREAVKLSRDVHDVVVERSDISGWGTNSNYMCAISGYYNYSDETPNLKRIIVQRNRIYNPRYGSNDWGSGHPSGPQAVCYANSGGNHVIRYNEVFSTNGNYYNDIFGGGSNSSTIGYPGPDCDIYGNKISNCWDDGIESEGGNQNVRIWGNYIDQTFVKIGIADTNVGPIYIWRNVMGSAQRYENAGTGDGAFIKGGGGQGRIYIFHNTLLQPGGCSPGISNWGGSVNNLHSRNNILHVAGSGRSVEGCSNSSNSFDYDLYNGSLSAPSGSESHGIHSTPTYNNPSHSGGDFSLTSSSPGYDDGVVLFNFNDGYTGAAPDMGAHEAGTPPMEFGVDAYTTPQPSPTSGPTSTPTPRLSPTPMPTPGDYVIYEAEEASLTNAQVETEHLGFTGSGYVNFLSLSGGRVSWNNLSVSSGGDYNLTFRYALGATDRAVEIRVNGNTLASSLNFPATGAWTNWSTLNLVVPLNPGNNTLEAITIGADGPNLDHLKVPTSPSPIIPLSQGWNEIVWTNISGKKASDIPSVCPMVVAQENFWFRPYIKDFGGMNFSFESGKTYYLKCNQDFTWSL